MTVKIEEGRIPVPEDWVREMGLGSEVELTRAGRGFLVTPRAEAKRQVTWDEIFANKIPIGKPVAAEADDDIELTGDDYFL